MINDRMPEYTVERAGKLLNRLKKPLNGARVLLLGVAYKQDIADYRESPALRVMEEFRRSGAETAYYDPFVPRCRYQGQWYASLPELTTEAAGAFDLAVVTTAHSGVDYGAVLRAGVPVFDCKNVMKDFQDRTNIEVL